MRHVNCALTQPLSDARLGIPTRSGCDLCSAGSACWYPRRAYLYLQILVAERVRCTSTVSATDTCPTVRHHPQRFRSLRSRDCPPLRHERPFLPRMKRTCSMVSVSPRTAPRSSPPVSRPWVQAARPLLTSFTAVDPTLRMHPMQKRRVRARRFDFQKDPPRRNNYDHPFSPIICFHRSSYFGTEVPTAAVARAHPLFRWIALICGARDLRAELLLENGVAIPPGGGDVDANVVCRGRAWGRRAQDTLDSRMTRAAGAADT